MLLIIGGFDPTSKAGILGDTSMAATIPVSYSCCITTNTVQTEDSFLQQSPTEATLFKDQLEALLKSIRFTAVKIGFLPDLSLAKIVHNLILQYQLKNIVIDPVIVGKRADRILVEGALLDFYINHLFPLAELITPNWNEACVLLGSGFNVPFSVELMEHKAKLLSGLAHCNVLISGKNSNNKHVDCLFNHHTKEASFFEGESFVFDKALIGLGCRFSTAIGGYLSLGFDLSNAVSLAKLKVREYLETVWKI